LATIHTRQLQQYTQDNYNDTHKNNYKNTQIYNKRTATTINTTTTLPQDNYNNTHIR